jgi:hypothetical protein
LPTFVVGGVFDDSHSNRSEVESWCGFDLHFLYGQGWWHFFMCSLAIWISSFEKVLFLHDTGTETDMKTNGTE